MSAATAMTVGVLALLLVAAMLSFAVGCLWERQRNNGREAKADREGFEDGHATREATRKLWARKQVGR